MTAPTHTQTPDPAPDSEVEALRRRVEGLERVNSMLKTEHIQLERISRVFHVTHALAVAMQSASDISEVHERVLTLITAELGYERAVLAVVETHDMVLTGWLCSTSGPGGHVQRMPHTARLPLDDESWPLVASLRSGTPLLVADGRSPTGDVQANALLGLCGYVVLPMVLLGQPLGVLIVDNPLGGRALTAADRDLLQHVANHTAVMIGGIQTVVSRAQRLAIEEERARIALEIHDAISQQLYGITYTIGACARQLPANPESVREQLLYLLPQAQHAAQGLRRAIFDLWPDDLDAARFKEELSAYLEEIAAPPRPLLFLQVDAVFDMLPALTRRQLYRIAQEALNNAAKHAAARQAKLTLLSQGAEVVMRIADNGRGFDLAGILHGSNARGHYGFTSMRERAETIGGQLRIDSAPDEGTTLTVMIPFRIRDA
ncbi:GAF domain-containing protein [Oscillochloris sp. ZM17-4]|uniref:GAF domain-containing sensor histidine kinase n=1 Tax=Oscillochloris sp. ZM17-4 TaxID=2866714 RepID=UPI001C73D94F|nr:GAF domain-containing protein [Oscillochloris sp. ZM17-4]MBX0330136.1 GAF domain-containing protein [Oscillochloris sp. ZM17-4]